MPTPKSPHDCEAPDCSNTTPPEQFYCSLACLRVGIQDLHGDLSDEGLRVFRASVEGEGPPG